MSVPAGAIAWIMQPLSRHASRGAGEFSPSCVQCGSRAHVPALEPSYEGGGGVADHLWLCAAHHRQAEAVFGRPGSPGRPPMSAHDAKIQKYRAMSASMKSRRSQAPAAPSSRSMAPSMPRPGPATPPRPGIFS